MESKQQSWEVPPESTRLTNMYRTALQTTPDKTAVIVGDQQCTYRKLDEMAELYGRALTGIGVAKDTVVGIFMPDCLELIWLFLACNRIGAIANMTSAFTQTEEFVYETGSSQTAVLLVHSKLHPIVENIQKRVPSLQKIFIVDAPDEHPLAWSRVVAQAPVCMTPTMLTEEQVAVIFYTSGSTAKPKGVTHTHRSFFEAAYNLVVSRKHDARDIFAMSFHLSHCAAYRILLSMFYCGGTSIFYDDEQIFKKFDAGAFIKSLKKYGVTHVLTTPSQWRQVLGYSHLQKEEFTTVRYLSCAGDAMTSDLQRETKEKLNMPLSVVLGMTECGSYILTREVVDPLPGEIGYPIHATNVRLMDGNDKDVPKGEVGQIIVQTAALMRGYWNDSANTAAVLKNGWLYTGDLARQDERGSYFFVGRCKNTIIRGGGNIAPEEVEDAISKHPAVKNCAVTGVPDAKYGQAVAAVVVLADPLASPPPGDLTEFLTPLIAARKIPEHWYFATELPLNSVAKLDRKQLAELVRQLAAKQGE